MSARTQAIRTFSQSLQTNAGVVEEVAEIWAKAVCTPYSASSM
jgi:hypothetical protein